MTAPGDAPLERGPLYEALVGALSQLGEGLTVYEAETQHAIYANQAICDITGYTFEEMREMDLFQMVVEEQKEELLARQQARYRGESVPDHYELEIESKDGRRVDIEVTIKHIEVEGRKLYLALSRDVTERNKALRERHESVQALADSQRRQRQALEINNELVQGLAVAKYALELGEYERAAGAIDHTLRTAQTIVGELLEADGETDLGPLRADAEGDS